MLKIERNWIRYVLLYFWIISIAFGCAGGKSIKEWKDRNSLKLQSHDPVRSIKIVFKQRGYFKIPGKNEMKPMHFYNNIKEVCETDQLVSKVTFERVNNSDATILVDYVSKKYCGNYGIHGKVYGYSCSGGRVSGNLFLMIDEQEIYSTSFFGEKALPATTSYFSNSQKAPYSQILHKSNFGEGLNAIIKEIRNNSIYRDEIEVHVNLSSPK